MATARPSGLSRPRVSDAEGLPVQGLLLEALAERLPETSAHAGRVAGFAVRVGVGLGLSDADLVTLDRAAELHDVGKLGVPVRLLRKSGPLDPAERALVQRHAEMGGGMLAAAAELAALAPVVRAVHERYDGQGYPDGAAHRAIPWLARTIAVCDALDAICSARPYRRAASLDFAVNELREGAGGQFDPVVVAVVLDVIAREGYAPGGDDEAARRRRRR